MEARSFRPGDYSGRSRHDHSNRSRSRSPPKRWSKGKEKGDRNWADDDRDGGWGESFNWGRWDRGTGKGESTVPNHITCFRCNGNHYVVNCPAKGETGKGGKGKTGCWTCGGDHAARDCPQGPQGKGKGKEKEEDVKLETFGPATPLLAIMDQILAAEDTKEEDNEMSEQTADNALDPSVQADTYALVAGMMRRLARQQGRTYGRTCFWWADDKALEVWGSEFTRGLYHGREQGCNLARRRRL